MYWIIVQEMTNLYFGWDSDMRGHCLTNVLPNKNFGIQFYFYWLVKE